MTREGMGYLHYLDVYVPYVGNYLVIKIHQWDGNNIDTSPDIFPKEYDALVNSFKFSQ